VLAGNWRRHDNATVINGIDGEDQRTRRVGQQRPQRLPRPRLVLNVYFFAHQRLLKTLTLSSVCGCEKD
jgi:hypothetical protein